MADELAERSKKFKMSPEDIRALKIAQDNRCAICRLWLDNWAIDHDHSCCDKQNTCGKCVRGILCHRCNIGLGMFKDNPDNLLRAISYLQEHNGRIWG